MPRRAPLAALLLALVGPAAAQETVTVAPVFGRVVALAVPEGFVTAWEQANAQGYIREAVPEGETVEDWTRMVTLSGHRGLGAAGPAALAAAIADGFAASCPGSFAGRALGPVEVAGADGAEALWLGCGALPSPARSEASLILVVRGGADAFTVQWAERAGPLDGPPAFDAGLWEARLGRLAAGARLCPPVPGEGPPYPSCAD